ncbi:N-formylglutamate deformylase [Chlorella sorokiniana]|uniref:N-formylglutamate deformylase n=1 Tax=Chlorella sorokiniana TaxID=3076 RepID=A0A2P6TYL0_CHLSO|nr:N-formylglutamate deformylase [Chlorella sorokiniana]|eukprot:PRW59156.1 N-formylglutamate deformylase [Chlorella sorokiniana]
MQHVITSTTVKQWHFADEKPHSGSQLSTANRRSAPQLYIKGVTPKPKALMKDKAEDKSNWLAVVVIKHGCKPAVYPVPRKANPHPNSVWLRKEGNLQHVDLTGRAYVKIMHQHLIGKGNLSDGTITRPRRTRYLLHDRDPAHTSKSFKTFAANYSAPSWSRPSRQPMWMLQG